MTMNNETTQHSGAWVTFTYASFIGSAAMVALGILFMPMDIWIKGYLAMGTINVGPVLHHRHQDDPRRP